MEQAGKGIWDYSFLGNSCLWWCMEQEKQGHGLIYEPVGKGPACVDPGSWISHSNAGACWLFTCCVYHPAPPSVRHTQEASRDCQGWHVFQSSFRQLLNVDKCSHPITCLWWVNEKICMPKIIGTHEGIQKGLWVRELIHFPVVLGHGNWAQMGNDFRGLLCISWHNKVVFI